MEYEEILQNGAVYVVFRPAKIKVLKELIFCANKEDAINSFREMLETQGHEKNIQKRTLEHFKIYIENTLKYEGRKH